jgi:hypothetical protein
MGMKRISGKTAVVVSLVFVILVCVVYAIKTNSVGERQTAIDDQAGRPVTENMPGFTGSSNFSSRPTAIKGEALEEKFAGGTGAVYQGAGEGMSLPNLKEKVVRTANLEIRINKDRFNDVYDRAVGIVNDAGGYVSRSKSTTNGSRIAGGELAIRVPAGKFEDVLKSLKKLGKVKSLDISSEEVTSEYVDLQSRLRNWRAQEAVMLDLMKRAKTVSESIAVQNNLQQIQMEIEQISGRLQYLDDRVSYSEISLYINEPSVVPLKDKLGLKTALGKALKASSQVLSLMIVTLGYLFPLIIIGALLFIIYKPIKRRATAK